MSSNETPSVTSDGDGAHGTPPQSPDEAGIWLAAIFESSRDAIIGTDVSGSVTSWNNAAEAVFGFAADEIVGQPIGAIIPSDRMEEETAILDRIGRGEKFACFETARRHKNGTVVPVSVTISPIRDRRNRVIGACEIARDLSVMQSVRRELEQREAQLQQAYKMVAIGHLASGAAHDFNNILQSVINALELVLDDVGEDTPARQFTDIAIKAAVRGASLTGHMLSYARERAAQLKIIDLGPFLYDIRELLGRTLGSHIDVTITLDGTPSLLADPGQLQTALLNLAINASHAMPRGGALTMAASMESEDGEPFAVVAFTDTGAGMDKSTLSRDAEPFFLAKGAGSNGLGPSMAYDYAERSGGSLRIASVPGQGTTVRLCMPSNLPDHQDVRRTAPAKPQSPGRILLVDDLTEVLLNLTALLARAGFKVTPADSGTQALAILTADGPFDVLITDFAMPGMNGADLITRCRNVQPGLRALVITGLGGTGFADTLPKGTDVLRKPVQRKDLIEAVHRLMRRDQDEWVTPFLGQTLDGQKTGNGRTGEPRGGHEQPPGTQPLAL